MAEATGYVRWFDDIGLADVPLVGGKTASLGELHRLLKGAAVTAPDGFALTAAAYRDALAGAGIASQLAALFSGLDLTDVASLAERAAQARALVYAATGGERLAGEIRRAYRTLKRQYGPGLTVAVRSSATAEDLPTASFAGQHETFLHVKGEAAVVDACRRCFASLFTDRAVVYRADNGFDHMKVALSVAVMRMVHSDRASSGVTFTLDTETGFRDVVFVTGVYGLGETLVQGAVGADEFYVHKPTLRQGHRMVLHRTLGEKATRLVRQGGALKTFAVARRDRDRFCLTDAEVLDLADVAVRIEDHYSTRAGRPTPMDIEWAKDAGDGRLYVLQARPETVASRRDAATLETWRLDAPPAAALVTGRAVGERIAGGIVRRVDGSADLEAFQPGEVLVARTTSPDWQPVMKTAGAIVTDEGARTCHAAIVARELGVPAVVGAGDATTRLATGQTVTVSCAEGEAGHVYDGAVPFRVERVDLDTVAHPRTRVMLNLAQPGRAFHVAALPAAGVGLARMEFIISEQIRLHPMAAAHPERLTSARERAEVARLSRADPSPRDYFVRSLAEGVGMIAAAFHPRPVIVRLSDFKTNEYAQLVGGADFEPAEENPMLGFRGAARYAHPRYADGFALECAALRRVRQEMGLTNLKVMVPFCRRVDEARQVLAAMAAHGLRRGEDGLEVYVMCEIPNNVIQIDAFAAEFDGFSIGSNDLTQLVLGVDRNSEVVAFDFDERDPGVLEMLRLAITGARRNDRPVGICGEAPATYPEIVPMLVAAGIDSLSVNADSLLRTLQIVAEAEAAAARPA
ncbi:phosphoenolpyruvate synthase [Caulobacter sp. KR2-114]|uniref:phosphoenolpyruvate synthase n=1 Tax=Caulobacter sp. KR2-114 TaxID=3400912 RepID=UPI003C0D3207